MRNRLYLAGAWLMLCLSVPAAAEAPPERKWHATLYLGQWLSSNLADVPRRLGTGDIEAESAYFASVLVNRVVVPELRTEWPLLGVVIDGGSLELEGQAGQHFGRQGHQEVTLSLLWRSRELTLPMTDLRVNFGVAEGFSYALSRPDFEGVENGEWPRKFLNYLAFEVELSHPAMPGVSLVPRLHHRSGIFGLIAPQGTGSNFLGLGIRMALP
jgi:hypothetical protein